MALSFIALAGCGFFLGLSWWVFVDAAFTKGAT